MLTVDVATYWHPGEVGPPVLVDGFWRAEYGGSLAYSTDPLEAVALVLEVEAAMMEVVNG